VSVYVDDFRAPAVVRRIRARWSHLTADTPVELHAFPALIGLRPEWFQGKCKYGACPTINGTCVHFHYDVTDARRAVAIAAGAHSISLREMGQLISKRRVALRS